MLNQFIEIARKDKIDLKNRRILRKGRESFLMFKDSVKFNKKAAHMSCFFIIDLLY